MDTDDELLISFGGARHKRSYQVSALGYRVLHCSSVLSLIQSQRNTAIGVHHNPVDE